MEGKVRHSTNEDLEAILDVWYRASRLGHPFMSDEYLESERVEILETYQPIAETLVYEVGGRVVGFLSLIDNEVGGLFVDPSEQRQGVGRALMNRARQLRPHLELAVFEVNKVGRRFYADYGFRPTGQRLHEETGEMELLLRLD